MDRSFVTENQVERDRLFALTDKLTRETLVKKLSNGWSVADALAHLAFWDSYCLSLLFQWEKSGFSVAKANIEATNEAVLALSRAIPVQSVVQLVREAAVAVDLKVEEIAPELVSSIEAGGQSQFLHRALHRRAHLSRIESELGL